MMVLCKSHCIYNKDRYCTRDIIRLDSSGKCEQCILENDINDVAVVNEPKKIVVRDKNHKAARSGGSLI